MLLTPQPASGSAAAESSASRRAMRSLTDIRVDMGLRLAARMGDRAFLGVAHGRSIAPERAGLIVVAARLPGLAALGELAVAEVDGERALLGVQADDVAVLQEPDRPADGRLGADMADAEAA